MWSIGNIGVAREVNKFRALERPFGAAPWSNEQTSFSRVRTQTGISISVPLRDELRYGYPIAKMSIVVHLNIPR